MRRLALWCLPAVLLAGEARYARLGDTEGRPEIQLRAADPWQPAIPNTPLLDGSWIRTAAGSRAEIELDEGSAFRMDADSLAELSDYTRLSTGQRVTLISLDRGVAYFTGEARGRDSLTLALPGMQAAIGRGARVRLEARETWSQIAVLEGAVLFSSPAAELQIKEGSTVRVEPANPVRFFLYREIAALESDKWSEARDKALATASAAHVAAPRYGLADLDAAGTWLETAAWGTIWKPRITAGWAPFRSGRWTWYDGLGYVWISSESWGWLPYHYGRWTLDENAGWVWVPGRDAVFSPGDVYWLRGAKLAGWGPLAPGEEWIGRTRPQLFMTSTSTFAAFVPEMRDIDPAGFASPKEPLAVAGFTAALPSPALPAARLEAKRPALRAGSTRIVPQLEGVTFGQASETVAEAAAAAQARQNSAADVDTTAVQTPAEPPVVAVPPAAEPVEVFYPVPVYTGIVVVNPPEHDDRDRRRRRQDPPSESAKPSRQNPKPAEQPKAPPQPAPAPAPPAPATPAVRRTEDAQRHESRPAEPARNEESKGGSKDESKDKPAATPIPRNTDQVSRPEGGTRRTDRETRRPDPD
jgi:hypothetical protein